jgi:hypothetical protein
MKRNEELITYLQEPAGIHSNGLSHVNQGILRKGLGK